MDPHPPISEAFYRLAFQALPVPSFIWDPATRGFLAVNEAAVRAYGYSAAEFLKMRMEDLGFPGEAVSAGPGLEHTHPGHRQAQTVRHRRKDGTPFIAECSSHRILFEGRPARVAVAIDITSRVVAEERYRQLVESVAEGIAIVDEREIFEFANSAAHSVFGVAPGGLPGRCITDFLAADQLGVLHRQTRQRQEGQRSTYELRIHRQTGEERILTINAVPRFDPEGRYAGSFVVFLDVTRRVQTEEALRQSEHRFRRLFEEIPLGVVIHRDGRVLYANQAAAEAVGLEDPTQAVGRMVYHFIPPEDLPTVAEREKVLLEGGEVPFIELRHLRMDGTPFPVDSRMMVLEPGDPPTLLSVFQDITERKRSEEALRQSQKLESLGVLAGGIAHDFNNLLTAMMGNLNLAQLRLPRDSAVHAFLSNLESAMSRASDLTRQMLAYSGRGRFVVRPLDLNQVVEEMTNLLTVSISKKVALRFRPDPGLPLIDADATQIQQVVMNLVINASEAIQDQEGSITLSTAPLDLDEASLRLDYPGQGLAPGPHAALEVSDTGSGMGPEVLEKIFDPFFTTKSTGRGLGLSAMQGILRGHKAGIHIQSEPGRGSRFRIVFPASKAARASEAEPSPAAAEAPIHGRILLVDDEPDVRHALKDMLEMAGYQVVQAEDGIQAMECFRNRAADFQCVVLDLTMPRMDGAETFKALRALAPHQPILLSSGYDAGEVVRPLLEQGRAAFLQKPYRFQALLQALQGLMRPEPR